MEMIDGCEIAFAIFVGIPVAIILLVTLIMFGVGVLLLMLAFPALALFFLAA